MTLACNKVHQVTATLPGDHNPAIQLAGPSTTTRFAYAHLCAFALLLLLGTVAAFVALFIASAPKHHPLTDDLGVRFRHLHAAVMTYLCLIPGVPVALSGLLLPKVVGYEHFQSIRLARASLIAYSLAAVTIIISVLSGGIDSGISYFAAYSRSGHFAAIGVAIGVLLVGIACAFNGLQAITVVRSLLSDRSRSRKVPFLASMFCLNGTVHIFLLPVQCLTITLMLVERFGRHSFFDPSRGGNAILLRQISWFYLHPVMLVSILPAVGLIGYVIDQVSTKEGAAHSMLVRSGLAVSILGLFTWGVHLLQAGVSPLLSTLSSALNLLLMVPVSLLIADCLAAMGTIKNEDRFSAVFAMSALLMLSLGLLAGVAPSLLGVNSSLHGTDFIVGHVHLVGSATCILSVLAGLNSLRGGSAGDKRPTYLVLGVSICSILALFVTFALQLIEGINEAHGQHVGGATSRHWSILFQSSSIISCAGLLTISILFVSAMTRIRKVRP